MMSREDWLRQGHTRFGTAELRRSRGRRTARHSNTSSSLPAAYSMHRVARALKLFGVESAISSRLSRRPSKASFRCRCAAA